MMIKENHHTLIKNPPIIAFTIIGGFFASNRVLQKETYQL